MFLFTIIGIMLCGVGIGFLLRKRKINRIHIIITGLIWLLLFLLGMEVGHNEAIVKGLKDIGLDALFITLAAVTGSSLFAWLLWIYIAKKEGRRNGR